MDPFHIALATMVVVLLALVGMSVRMLMGRPVPKPLGLALCALTIISAVVLIVLSVRS